MEQAKLDKIRRVLERMDDGYWEDLAYQTGVFDTRLQDKAAELTELLSNLVLAQCDVLSARSEGFKQILQAAANAAIAAQTAKTGKGGKGSKTAAKTEENAINTIIAANTTKLAELTGAKAAVLSDLSDVLTDIQAIFDETAKLGETFTGKPTQDNTNK